MCFNIARDLVREKRLRASISHVNDMGDEVNQMVVFKPLRLRT